MIAALSNRSSKILPAPDAELGARPYAGRALRFPELHCTEPPRRVRPALDPNFSIALPEPMFDFVPGGCWVRQSQDRLPFDAT